MSELEIERDTHKTRQQKERERSKRMQEKEWKRDRVGEPGRERVYARGSVGQRERQCVCDTLCVRDSNR